MKTLPAFFENRISFESKIKPGRPLVGAEKIIEGFSVGTFTVTNEPIYRIKEKINDNKEGRTHRACYYVNVDCSCGNNIWIKTTYLIARKPTACRKCRAARRKGKFKTLDVEVKLWRDKFYSLRKSAKDRNYDFNLTPEYLKALFYSQNYVCALTGQKISFELKNVSVDRIKNKEGYVIGNIQFADLKANKIKFDMEMDEFILFCHRVVDYHKK